MISQCTTSDKSFGHNYTIQEICDNYIYLTTCFRKLVLVLQLFDLRVKIPAVTVYYFACQAFVFPFNFIKFD